MKIEKKRDDTVFISHNGLTLFFNQRKNKETNEKFYSINVHVNEGTFEDKKWVKAGEMIAQTHDVQKLCELLGDLNK